MKTWVAKNLDYVNWDRLGMGLSALCALHCLLTPLLLLFLPMIAAYYLIHPLFHLLLAIAILPVGLMAFVTGFRHHRKAVVFAFGLPGLAMVCAIPYLAHGVMIPVIHENETALMVVGSSLLVLGHWFNRRACSDCAHHSAH